MTLRRVSLCWAVLAVAFTGLALAQSPPREVIPVDPTYDLFRICKGDQGIRHFEPLLYPEEPGPIEMPEPIDPEPARLGVTPGAIAGAKIDGAASRSLALGGALVGPRGGVAISTPRTRADREIKALIRRLD